MTTLYKNLPTLKVFFQKIHTRQQESFPLQLHKENIVPILVLLFYTHSEVCEEV